MNKPARTTINMIFKAVLTISLLAVLSSRAIAQLSMDNVYNGVELIVDKFDVNDIVAIGETHDKVEITDFYIQVVENEEFRRKVDFIVIEMGNHLFQDVLDAYVAGKSVDERDLYRLWRDHTCCMLNDADNTGLIRFLKRVRAVNQNSEHKIKVLAADPPIDWSQVNCLQDYYKFLGNRDEHYSKIVIDKVMKAEKKALIIMGNSHFNKLRSESMIEKNLHNPITAIMEVNRSKVFLINILAISSFPYKSLSKLKAGSIITTEDVWMGNLDLSHPFILGQKLKEQTDAILYLGSYKSLTTEPNSKFNDPEYKLELSKRKELEKCE